MSIDLCVCVFTICRTVCAHLLNHCGPLGVGPSWDHVVRWQRRSPELSVTGLDYWHHRHTSTWTDIMARHSTRNKGDILASGRFHTRDFEVSVQLVWKLFYKRKCTALFKQRLGQGFLNFLGFSITNVHSFRGSEGEIKPKSDYKEIKYKERDSSPQNVNSPIICSWSWCSKPIRLFLL